MRIKEVFLENYRNYHRETVHFDKNVNLILGKNAQGKTNLIESIYLCSFGKSFRTNRDRELIRFNQNYCRVCLSYEREEDSTVEIVLTKEGKKAAKIDGVKVNRSTDLLDHVITVVFSPEDLKIVKEDPSKRRNFIDRELSQLKLSYLNTLKLYNRVLSQRNAFLKEKPEEKEGLEIWDEKIAEYGALLMEERTSFIEKLSEISGRIHQKITNGKEQLSILYKPSVKREKEDQKSVLLKTLEKEQEKDFLNGMTRKGPHKDDFEVIVNQSNVRYYGSQGQQRTVALSLKLAEIELIKEEKKEMPVLLLDDVMSELDGERQQDLIKTLQDVQIFITTTEITDDLKNALSRGKILRIEDGQIK